MTATRASVDISEFIALVDQGIESWEQAGAELLRLKEHDPDVYDTILDGGWLTRDALEMLEQIGLKKIHPLTLLLPTHVFDAVSKLPYEEQAKLATATNIEIANPEGKVVTKPTAQLTRAEVVRAITPTGVRKPSEQVFSDLPKKKQFKPAGTYRVTFMNGKMFIKEALYTNGHTPQRIEVSPQGTAIVQLFQEV